MQSVSQKKLWIISGATGIGKTAFSIRLAEYLNTEIISADSRQFFKELNIGVARPELAELERVKHHFIAHKSITEHYSAGKFADDASLVLDVLFSKHDHAVCVGGSGLYIQALIEGLDELPSDILVKKQIESELHEKGILFIQDKLFNLDPEYHQSVDIHNPHRLIRALEIIQITGEKYSTLRLKHKKILPYQPIILILTGNRDFVYNRINLRVDKMMENGLEEEVKNLIKYNNLNALNTVGYKELISYLSGEFNLEEAVSKIKQHSRNYAKRQETWWRRFPNANWIHVDTNDPMEYLLEKKLI